VPLAVAPEGGPSWLTEAILAGGGEPGPVDQADGLIWYGGSPAALASLLEANDAIRWVQLMSAGVEEYAHMVGDGQVWTCAKGAFAQTVAEHALALILALMRDLKTAATSRSWQRTDIRQLAGREVLIVGGGGIGARLIELLGPFETPITVVRRQADPVPGATRTIGRADLLPALATADVVILALPLTPETVHVIGEPELRAMSSRAILVNVARGRHVVTEALVRALAEGWIAGAGLDVTDPEPLPDGHPLWDAPNCIVTSHSANAAQTHQEGLSRRITENVRRYLAGRDLLGVVDPASGY
jgi:phosphoglycerate dehydrogenase-like enzyme